MTKTYVLWLLASNASVLLAVLWQTVQVAKLRRDTQASTPTAAPEGFMLQPAESIVSGLQADGSQVPAAPSARVAGSSHATADQILDFLANPAARDPRARAVILNWWNQENDMATLAEKIAAVSASLDAAATKLDTQADRLTKVEQIDGSQDQKIAALTTQVNELLAGAADPAQVDALADKANALGGKVDANGARLDTLASKTV